MPLAGGRPSRRLQKMRAALRISISGGTLMIASMAAYTVSTLIVQYITRYWKISTHALGITAPLVVLTLLYGNETLPFLVLIPMVGWARVYLKAHTVMQVIAGDLLGMGSTILFFHLFHVKEMISV